jgi:ABC-type Na+ efflux pump permease subunit
VIAVIIQLFIASFSSVILVGLMSFYDPESIGVNARISTRVGVIGDAGSPLVGFLKDRNIRVRTFPSPLDAENAFKAGAIDAVMFIPEDSGGVVEMKLFLPESESLSTMILMILKEPLKRYENYLREKCGVHIRYADIKGLPPTTYEFRYSFIIPILMFFPAFVAGSMVIDSISEELENRTLETLWAAPVSLNLIFGAKIAAALFLAVVQCVLWSMLLRFNRIYIQNLGLVLLLAAVVAAIIAVGSALISTYFKDRERSQFMYSLLISFSAGLSYFIDFSPVTLMTRLATGDYYTGIVDVAIYLIPLLALLATLSLVAKKLIAVKS